MHRSDTRNRRLCACAPAVASPAPLIGRNGLPKLLRIIGIDRGRYQVSLRRTAPAWRRARLESWAAARSPWATPGCAPDRRPVRAPDTSHARLCRRGSSRL